MCIHIGQISHFYNESSFYKLIGILFREQIKYIIVMNSEGKFLLGDLVFARCADIKPWPALIIKIIANQSKVQGNDIYKVRFFNHRSTANLYSCDLDKFTLPLAQAYLDKYANSVDKEEKSISRAIIFALDYIKGKQNQTKEKNSKKIGNILCKQTESGEKNKSDKSEKREDNIIVGGNGTEQQVLVVPKEDVQKNRSEDKQNQNQLKLCTQQMQIGFSKTKRKICPIQTVQNPLSKTQLCPPSASQQKYQPFLQKQSSIIELQNIDNFKFQSPQQKFMPKTAPSSPKATQSIQKLAPIFQIPKETVQKQEKEIIFVRSKSKLLKSPMKEELTCPPEETKTIDPELQPSKKRSIKQREQSQISPPKQGVNQKRRRICKQKKYAEFLQQLTLLHRSSQRDEACTKDIQWHNKYQSLISCSMFIKNDFRLYSQVDIHAFLNKYLSEVLEYLNLEYNNKQYEQCHSLEIKCCFVGCLGNVTIESMLRKGCVDKMIAIVDAYAIAGLQQKLNCNAEYLIILRYLDINISMYKASGRSFEFSSKEKVQMKSLMKLYYNERKGQ